MCCKYCFLKHIADSEYRCTKYIGEKVHPDEKLVWVQCHIGKGFAALEKLLKDYAGKYATGDEVCLSDAINRQNERMSGTERVE
ncbi:unnamed protein product [Camellia sinensis]